MSPWTVARQASLSMEILQARTLEWVAVPSSRGSSQPWGPNSGLPHYRQILYQLQGKPKNTGVGSLSLLQGIFPTQELNWGILHCRWILYFTSWATREIQDTYFIGVSLVNAYKYACVSKWTEVCDIHPPRKRISGV